MEAIFLAIALAIASAGAVPFRFNGGGNSTAITSVVSPIRPFSTTSVFPSAPAPSNGSATFPGLHLPSPPTAGNRSFTVGQPDSTTRHHHHDRSPFGFKKPPFATTTATATATTTTAPTESNGSEAPDEEDANDTSNVGAAIVHNACPFAVYSNIVHSSRPGEDGAPEEIGGMLAPGNTLTHAFSHDPNIGISWKLWREDVANTNPVQLEYTWASSAGRVYYDLSMINAGDTEWLEPDDHEGEVIQEGANNDGTGNLTGEVAVAHAFGGDGEGIKLVPNGGGGNCGAITCAAGESYCTGAYNTDDDNQAMRDCGDSGNLELTLCG